TGAASSEAALLIIDAKEGVKEQSKRHGYLLHLLGVQQVAVVVNKMDLIDYDQTRFDAIEAEYRAYLKSIGVEPTYFIPVSAREGDLMVEASSNMPWYSGPSVVEALDHFQPLPARADLPLRLPVQDVYKFDERRIIVGRIESGSLKVDDEILFSPTNTPATIASIEAWGAKENPTEAFAGQSVGITLTEQIFVERGHVASHVDAPPMLSNVFRARLFWLGRTPLLKGKRYKLKLGTAELMGDVQAIEQVVNTSTLAHEAAEEVERNSVAEVLFHVRGITALDEFTDNPRTGRFVVIDDCDVAGGGIISMEGLEDQRVSRGAIKSENLYPVDMAVTPEQRAIYNGHTGGILWFTGLSGSGKSTLALELEKRLFAKGYQVYVLDGDNVRAGLNSDLGFAPEDRAENIRRVGEVAALFAQAGVIVITAFISPYAEDRRRARAAAADYFNAVYIKADLETCEKRDVKGLYKKAREGKILEFTGISAPYEEPDNPELVVDTRNADIVSCVRQLEHYVERNFVDPVKNMEHWGHHEPPKTL
ncbi:MAG: adenylyl-sulfate kinase, partial [Rickettsiales bacterium]